MSRKVARVGDKWSGVCKHPDHSSPISVDGEIIEGSDFFTNQGISIARHGDRVRSSCGHVDTIVSTTTKFTVSGIDIARIEDYTTGSILEGQIVEGSGILESN